MAYFSIMTKSNPLLAPSSMRFSLRSVKGIVVGLLLSICLGFMFLWQPAYLQLRSLEQNKDYWQQVLRTDVSDTKTDTKAAAIPTFDQLPDIIEQCRGVFVKEGVDLVSLNVERFGERGDIGKGAKLDYSLVRLHLRGQWEGVVTALKILEERKDFSIHVQEVVLNADGEEALLQIYFISQ
ncbi:hypothetical protein E4K67_14040 [Desulfosporosinus fructosivorans]|uniref:Uncharacterized protein n=1 Tax=Desulfosporosinus fructosivorans TaxID=2018669 RepID=A0A4Z0R5K5_9FIRM|nr:hypothetical protein [Desulfosporosinus fructosivorans]TGE37824.1 hypothetical protein E4K67_14040 [Desulfosporosinus fructosivorans]